MNISLPETLKAFVDDQVTEGGYQTRKPEARYARPVEMAEIEKNDFNLNISRYISTAVGEEVIDLLALNTELMEIETTIQTATAKHNEFLKELGLRLLPTGNGGSAKA